MLPHISIRAEKIFELYGLPITNSLLLSVLTLIVIGLIIFFYNRELSKTKKSNFYYFITFFMRTIYGLFDSIFDKETRRFFPIVGAFFFFILLQNWLGLLPGVGSILIKVHEHGIEEHVPLFRSNSADLNSTVSLAIMAVFLVQYFGIKEVGFKNYIGKFVNLKSPISFFVGILEVISELSRVLSFSFRLFGNVFAGEVLLTIIAFLIPILVSFPFLVLEVFVGLIQALVFSMLAAVLFKLSMTKAPH